jgi:AbrB family looped-hinge helix DNA binding protein
MNPIHAKVSESGRLSLPAELRRAVGLDRGGDVVVELDGKEIRIRTMKAAAARAQAIARRIMGDDAKGSVDAFIAGRRREAAKEEAEAKKKK